MTLVLNKFTYSNQKGILKNPEHAQVYQCLVSGDTLVPGDFVKLKNVSGARSYVVEKITADTDAIFGMVPYEPARKNSYAENDMVSIASDYSLVICEASAAINGGADVMAVITGAKVATATAGKTVVGMAMNPAAADGDLVCVRLETSRSTVSLGTVTALSAGATAVMPITHQVVKLTTTAASAISLADGTDGQRLSIILITDGGTATITPAHFGNGTTVALDDAGDAIDLVFANSQWYLLGNIGATVA